MPKRIQRKRTKGWKMPPNTVYVGRPSKWGNPFKVGQFMYYMDVCHFMLLSDVKKYFTVGKNIVSAVAKKKLTREDCINLFNTYAYRINSEKLSELKGKNLACWCKEGDLCHADILLKLANE